MTDARLWQQLRPADGATLLNAVMGLLAIAAAFVDLELAIHLTFAAILVDGLDGAIARMGGGGGPLGPTLDTLADVVTFVVAPAVILMAASDLDPVAGLAAVVYVSAGLLRLARFTALPDRPYFRGLSTPGGAIVLGTGVLIAPGLAMPLAAVLAAVLMLSPLPVPKLRGRIGLIGATIIAIHLITWQLMPAWSHWTLLAQLAATALYLALGPSYTRKRLS